MDEIIKYAFLLILSGTAAVVWVVVVIGLVLLWKSFKK